MKLRTTASRMLASALLATSAAFGFACGGDDSGGPTLITLKDAGQSTGTGGSTGGAGGTSSTGGTISTGIGGDSTSGTGGDSSDAGASGGGSAAAEGGAGGGASSDATSDAGCIVNPVTFDDYLNACPDQRVLACFTFRTTLPNPLPPLP